MNIYPVCQMPVVIELSGGRKATFPCTLMAPHDGPHKYAHTLIMMQKARSQK